MREADGSFFFELVERAMPMSDGETQRETQQKHSVCPDSRPDPRTTGKIYLCRIPLRCKCSKPHRLGGLRQHRCDVAISLCPHREVRKELSTSPEEDDELALSVLNCCLVPCFVQTVNELVVHIDLACVCLGLQHVIRAPRILDAIREKLCTVCQFVLIPLILVSTYDFDNVVINPKGSQKQTSR